MTVGRELGRPRNAAGDGCWEGEENMSRERAVAIGQTLGVLILMSLGTVLTKRSLHDVPPLTFASLSIAAGIGTLGFYTFVVRRERIPAAMGRRVWAYIVAIGVCNFTLGRVLTTLSLQRMPATTNAFLTNFVGLITMGMSIVLLGESPSFFQLLGAAIAVVGLRVFFAAVPAADELVGILLLGAGILAIAFTNNAARKLALITGNGVGNTIISTLALTIGGAITVVVGLVAEWPPRVTGTANWAAIIYAGVAMIAVSMTVWNHVLRTLRSYEASILGASTVIWTTIIAVPLLGERISARQFAGMALLLLGLTCVQIRKRGASSKVRRSAPLTGAGGGPRTGQGPD